MNEDDSQSEPLPEAGVAQSQTTQISGLYDAHGMVTGFHVEVTKIMERRRSNRSQVTLQVSHNSDSEDTPATVEAEQILQALKQLANNSNSANFNINPHRISKLPKSLITTMPTFDEKPEMFELFRDVTQTSLKSHSQLSKRRQNQLLPLSDEGRCATDS